MIKKQVDWDVRVQPFVENQYDPRAMLKSTYPSEDGWELLSAEPAQVGGNAISVVYTFARYEWVFEDFGAVVPHEEAVQGEVKRGPGRPKKVEVEPA